MRERFGSAVAAEGEADLFFDADDIVVCFWQSVVMVPWLSREYLVRSN
jgi:hypothetical protein